MILAISILSLLFVGIGFIVTENNAKYLLAGYNTMSDAEKNDFDIKSYIPHFRKFHIFLGLSLFVLSIIIYYSISPDWSGIFMVIYPILTYVYFTWKANKYFLQMGKKQKRKRILSLGILCAVLVGITGMFYYSLQDNTIIINNNVIEIKGDYGMNLDMDNIKFIELVGSTPDLSIKLNGFALANVKKGYFKTRSGQKVKLLLNNMTPPIICIELKDGFRIYYSSKNRSNQLVFEELKKAIDNKLQSKI